MQYDRNEHNMDIIGELTSNKMTIKDDDGKLFSMLVDSLYSDKYGSVIRELSTNAVDSHSQVDKMDVQYDIHLPSDANNKFKIRDYGVGLSKENVIRLFTELLGTTKDQDNKFVGYYGIGCKSPFSVTDEFLVTSFYKGLKTTVMFSRQGKQVPEYLILSEEKSDQPTGIEISFVGDVKDQRQWEYAIETQLAQFKIKPNVYIDGMPINIDYNLPEHKYGMDYYSRGNNVLYVEMGGVLYPCSNIYDEQLKEVANFSWITPIIHVPIGAIDVPPSRETVEFTPKTIKAIHDHVVDLKKTVLKNIENKFNEEFEDNYAFQSKLINHYRSFSKYFCIDTDQEFPISFTTKNEAINSLEFDCIFLDYDDREVPSIISKKFNLTQKLRHDLKVKVHSYRNGELLHTHNKSIEDILSLDGTVYVCHNGNKSLAHKHRRGVTYYTVTSLKRHHKHVHDILTTFSSYFDRDGIKIIEGEIPNKVKIPNKIIGLYKDCDRYARISLVQHQNMIDEPLNYLYTLALRGYGTGIYDGLNSFNVLKNPKTIVFATPSKVQWLIAKGIKSMVDYTNNLSVDDLELEKAIKVVVDNYVACNHNQMDSTVKLLWEILKNIDNIDDLLYQYIGNTFDEYLNTYLNRKESIYGFLELLGLVSLSEKTNCTITNMFKQLGYGLKDEQVQNMIKNLYIDKKLTNVKGKEDV